MYTTGDYMNSVIPLLYIICDCILCIHLFERLIFGHIKVSVAREVLSSVISGKLEARNMSSNYM